MWKINDNDLLSFLPLIIERTIALNNNNLSTVQIRLVVCYIPWSNT